MTRHNANPSQPPRTTFLHPKSSKSEKQEYHPQTINGIKDSPRPSSRITRKRCTPLLTAISSSHAEFQQGNNLTSLNHEQTPSKNQLPKQKHRANACSIFAHSTNYHPRNPHTTQHSPCPHRCPFYNWTAGKYTTKSARRKTPAEIRKNHISALKSVNPIR